MRTPSRRRKGFTLIETVTTVGIIAVMAAVVIPQVTRQFDSADPARLVSDVTALQTAIETFHVNLRSVYPGDLDDLTNPLTAGVLTTNVDTALASTGLIVEYSTAATLWKGPYVGFSLATGDTKVTAFNALILDDFACYVAAGTAANTAGNPPTTSQSCAGTDATSRLFLAIRITGLGTDTDAKFIALNDAFDSTTEGVNRKTLGRVRWLDVGPGTPTAFFLAAPLN